MRHQSTDYIMSQRLQAASGTSFHDQTSDKLDDQSVAMASPRETIERINHDLVVDAFIWDRDSHGLFDYESKSLTET